MSYKLPHQEYDTDQSRQEKELLDQWKRETQAPFQGWDFSYLEGRWQEDQPDFKYKEQVADLLHQDIESALDIGTGGGEFLLKLKPFPPKMKATESWPPNVSVAKERLKDVGVEVVGIDQKDPLPFADQEFDTIINRQDAYQASEVMRVLKDGGKFFTQQVPADNLFDLAAEFGIEKQGDDWNLDLAKEQFVQLGAVVKQAREWEGKMQFNDIGALVYYLSHVPWVVPDFKVEKYQQELHHLEQQLKDKGSLVYTQKRFLLEVEKK
ncbi:MAG: class I SAM-dependent methyltransferase [Candidatus Uhrbacteria bacterium]